MLKDVDRKLLAGTVLLDFSAAVDLIDLLLLKLTACEFKPLAVYWMEEPLKQCVMFNGT